MLSASSSHLEYTRSSQHSETVKREPIPWPVSGKAGALDACTKSFPPQGEDEVWDFSPSLSGLCWVEGLTASAYMLFKPPSLFSEVPNLGSFPGSTQVQARQKPVRKSTQKSGHWMSGPVLLFPSEGESYDAVLEGGSTVRELVLPALCGLFHAHLVCRNLSVGFWICPKGNLSL